jgi:uncharacterized protein (TIGR03437 family)
VGQPDFSTTIPGPEPYRFGAITGLARAGNRLLVSDGGFPFSGPNNHRVLIFNDAFGPNGSLTAERLANIVVGQAGFGYVCGEDKKQECAIPAAGSTGMNRPMGISSDGQRLAVADSANNRVLLFNRIPETNGVAADVVLGQADFNLTTPATTQSGLRNPQGVLLHGGRLFIADTVNHRVLIFNSIPTSNNAQATVVLGQRDFTSRTQATTSSAETMLNPVAVTSDGIRLIVTDLGNNRVLIYNTIPSTNGAAADVVVGQPDFATTTAGITGTKLNFPRYAFSDGTRLYIADSGNNRVLVYNRIPTQNGAAPDAVLGQPESETAMEGTKAEELALPVALLPNEDGTGIWVADANNRRVVEYRSGLPLVRQGAIRNIATYNGNGMARPANFTAEIATGGTWPAGRYYFTVTALSNFPRESAPADELAVDVPADSKVTLRWDAINGATGYRVYVGRNPGLQDRYESTPPPDTVLAITTANRLPTGVVGTAVSGTFAASGGTAPYTWAASGTLPPGVTLSSAGALSGTPTEAGEFTFTVTVTDSLAATYSAEFKMRVEPAPPSTGLAITTVSPLPFGVVGEAYTQTLAAQGGVTPYTWSVSAGSLPPGITLDGATGALSGTPTTAGTYDFTMQVADSVEATARKPLTLVIEPPRPITTPPPNYLTLNALPEIPDRTFFFGPLRPWDSMVPGAAMAMFGTDLAPQTVIADRVPLPLELAGTSVLVNGQESPLLSVSPTQVVFQAPLETSGTSASVQVRKRSGGQEILSNALGIFLQLPEPAIFSLDGTGTGLALAMRPDGSLVTSDSPAALGEELILFGTGLGLLGDVPTSVETTFTETGGEIIPGTYFARITTIFPDGRESFGSGEHQISSATGNSTKITFKWTEVPGAAKYRIYVGNRERGYDRYFESTTNSFDFVSIFGTPGTPPVQTNVPGDLQLNVATTFVGILQGVDMPFYFAGPAPGKVGIWQMNGTVPCLTREELGLAEGELAALAELRFVVGAIQSNHTVLPVYVPPPPTIELNALNVVFGAVAGAEKPPSQVVEIKNSGGSTLKWAATITAITGDTPWLTVTPTSGTDSGTIRFTVDHTGLPPGTYEATVSITGQCATNTPQNMTVTLTVE